MIETTPISNRQDDDRQAFLRYLPKRIEAFEQRIQRYGKVGWDPAGMMVLRGDVQRLAETSGRYNLVKIRRNLVKLTQSVGDHIAKRSVPDPKQTAQMFELLSAVVAESHSLVAESQARSAASQATPATDVESASTATQGTNEPAESVEPAQPVEPVEPIKTPAPAEPVEPVEQDEQDEPAGTDETGVRRIYHLSDGDGFAAALGRRLESQGYAVEPLDTIEELSELVMCLLPHVLLVGSSHLSELAAIDVLRREVQQRPRPQRRIQLVAMATQNNAETRQIAQRAEVDLLLVPPFDIGDTVDRLQALHVSAGKEKMRVLIVEDNRADAFYVQTVLINAGMQAHVEQNPMKVLESLELLHPDLILMDLHMPVANGVEVTMLIREHPVFARLPIVFLSGESDPVSRLEAINAGGDDFMLKPIRPKQLIEGVRDRMRRMHRINKQ
jgi:CheY-like chemotaxis protein